MLGSASSNDLPSGYSVRPWCRKNIQHESTLSCSFPPGLRNEAVEFFYKTDSPFFQAASIDPATRLLLKSARFLLYAGIGDLASKYAAGPEQKALRAQQGQCRAE